ncbi:MAG TPA: galactose-1-epimerase, partial [Bacteroidales bacterium]|nr:galactose-1-epimerase [Bacteroidales bacterium]
MEITQELAGYSAKGEAIVCYTLTNSKGAYVKLSNLGANITGLGVPDRNGAIKDVVPGYADIRQYFQDPPYFGKSVGRYANRIAKGRFTLEGKEYRLAVNNGENHLHGGPQSMCVQLWVSRVEEGDEAVSFSYLSPDGEENYP